MSPVQQLKKESLCHRVLYPLEMVFVEHEKAIPL
jgi:hypothetical protein